MEIRDHLTRIWYPNNSLWNHFLLPDLVAGKQTTLWKVNRMYFVFLIWLLILHVLRQFWPTIQKVSVRFCRRAGNSGNENSCFSDLTLWCPMHEIRIKKGKVLVSIYPPSWIGTLWFCWPDFDSWKPNLGETESLDRNMEPITSDILELLQKDSTKYVRCRELLQRVFILSISYFWQMAPLQSKCWNRKILVIPATTQNFAQPLPLPPSFWTFMLRSILQIILPNSVQNNTKSATKMFEHRLNPSLFEQCKKKQTIWYKRASPS